MRGLVAGIEYPESTLHFEVAWRQGAPRRYTIARRLTERNRDAWEPLVPPGIDAERDGEDDRDEVPTAFTREGGKAPNGRSPSHIAYLDAPDNPGAGSYIGGRLLRYCNGLRFRVKTTGKRRRTAVIVVAFRDRRRAGPPGRAEARTGLALRDFSGRYRRREGAEDPRGRCRCAARACSQPRGGPGSP